MNRRQALPVWILLIIALLLLLLHLALPQLVRNYLNDTLADMGDYRGQIADVDLAWWRGAYQIEGLLIEKKKGGVPVPLLDAPLIDLAVSWRALWQDRAVVAEVAFVDPQLNFVDAREPGQEQTGEGVDWRDRLDALLPITLNEVHIRNGQVSFRNFTSDPQVNIHADQVVGTFYNLTNSTDAEGRRVAEFVGEARFLEVAPMEANARFDPFTDWEDFELRLRVTGVPLVKLNDFSRAYGRFDFADGTGDLVMEVEAENSQLGGYIKPLLRNVEVFDWEQDIQAEDKGFLRGLWEAIVGGGQTLLKNQRKDQFATRVELSGTIRDQDVSPFQVFLAVLRNAFIEAFSARFERSLEEGE
ncbi:hypothetical protein SF06_26550 [Pseudomonas flexibilis]|uniref:DUF748 domain-containing protein n=1 Tax=Pseudomonas flexibilis TaxID=706570 RepID=A0A1N6X2M3_9PSED|nr:DUF748 domain-containing protein [Pseudomonas flexibilis]KHL68507.1 hypothetical protein SF06_26550 [Pseudomonas flexibilis]SIQ96624.1 protein of unknown function [Pseudomonas flexibilis]